MSERVFLKPQEVCDMLNITRCMLDRWRQEKREPKWYRLGGSIRYDKADIEEFIELSARRK